MQHCSSLKAMATANASSSSPPSEEGEGTSSSSSSSDFKQETAPPKNTPIIAPAPASAPAPAPLPFHESQVHSSSPNVKPKSTVKISKTKTTLVSSVKSSAKRPSETRLESAKPKRHSKKASVAVASEQQVSKGNEPDEVNKGIEPDEVNKGIEEDANKQQQFQRVFSEKDEITLLQGMFHYFVEKGSDDSVDSNGFYDFIKRSIQNKVTKLQLSDKIKRLKRRFKNNQRRVFKHPSHEQQIFELSKRIWGKGRTKGKINFSVKTGLNLFDRVNAVAGMEPGDVIANFGLDTIGEESRAALEENFLKLQIAELELLLQHNELTGKKIKLILGSYKSRV